MTTRRILLAVVALALLSAPAEAGGLFGKRGLFRGSVGNWLDRKVEKPFLTPIVNPRKGVTRWVRGK